MDPWWSQLLATELTVQTETAENQNTDDPLEALKSPYLEALTLIERLHRRLLDVIKDDLDRLGHKDINGVQALLLFNIGESQLTAGELRTRGHYLGSNVSYNLKKLVDSGYIHHERSEQDRRAVLVCLTEKGTEIRDIVDGLYARHLETLVTTGELTGDQLATITASLRSLERFWTDQIRYTF